MKKIAIIPARGGSQRIPQKNIKDFCGMPIIAYPIHTALESQLFDEVVVSTDSELIAQVAKNYGASVPFLRPKELSDHFTPTIPVITHAITALNLASEDLVCCIYPATPLLKADSLKRGFQELIECPHKMYAFCAVEYDYNPYRSFYVKDNEINMLFPQHQNTRSQDLDTLFHDAGQFYWGRVKAFMTNLPIFAKHSSAIVLKNYQVQDIDTPDDWAMAEIKYKIQSKSESA
ncbi:pseudaminic acid cytidylyltransferase [Helicobacter sp. MIT 05-5293]|uniref:pseudaminic acid cytidylyltransferase n=1 Tax=Helicobacter sp. MIT 05-5293 TaxID=1548149 RepID=UPI00051D4BFD|nr:pseudaminic acid cytidylyltransferase [Helicobacter sp. MIT 05-5293]TLD81549.1 pseudaminic acid cytidylyltransferase [Helicobacter sp. MIT 05-5293]